MKRYTTIIVAALVAFVLGCGVILRSHYHRQSFDRTVHEALKTSEGYDQKFIDMVNRLEDVLAHRASFGYIGGKDPMTGKVRTVVVQKTPLPRKAGQPVPAIQSPQEQPDPVKLTAIIFDDAAKKFTAVIMVDERSYSVEQGEQVAGRKIQSISNERIIMEDDTWIYFYDISGNKGKKSKVESPKTTMPGPAPANGQAPGPSGSGIGTVQ